jgi:hypothetical protein
MAPRGRKPDPNHLKVVRGSRRQHPDGGGPQHRDPLGDPPTGWTPEQRALWHEVANAAPPGVLNRSDRLLVELTARLVGEVRGGNLTAAIATQLRTSLSELGMTPTARERLSKSDDDDDNPFTINGI